MTTRCTACGKPTPYYGFYTTCTACDVKNQIEQSRIKVGAAGAVREYLDLIERRLLDAAAPVTAMDAEERIQRRDDHADDGVLRVCGERREDGGAFCAARVGHNGPHEWAREVRYTPVGGHRTITAEPAFLGPCECGRPIYGTDMDRGRKCEVCRECTPPKSPTLRECVGHEYMVGLDMCRFCGVERRGATFPMSRPPTLREWLGDRVSDLGPWAEVLREQPVPAGWIAEWRWLGDGALGHWRAHGAVASAKPQEYIVDRSMVIRYTREPHATTEAYLMAIFTRHPAVKPEPRKAEIVCEDQYEVMP